MSIDSSTMNPNWAPQPSKPGMSGGAKLLIGIAIGCGIMMLLCCGGLFGVGFFMQRWVQKAINQDPAAVREQTASMLKIDVPAGLEPTLAFRMEKLPWGQDVGKAVPSFVVYADRPTESQLILVSATDGTSPQNQRLVRSQVNAMLQQQGSADEEDLQVEKTYPKELQIGDQKVVVTITKGKSPSTGKKRLRVAGSFQGNQEPIVLLVSVDAEKYDEETVIRMLESIKVKSPAVEPGQAKPGGDSPPKP